MTSISPENTKPKTTRRLQYLLLFVICGSILVGFAGWLTTKIRGLSQASVEFTAIGSLAARPITSQAATRTINGNWTGGCATNQGEVETRQCFEFNIIGQPQIALRSANCGSTVVATPAPDDTKCLLVREIRRGCGEEQILGIKNCRGRGWLDYSVTASGSIPSFGPEQAKQIEGTFTAEKPLTMQLGDIPLEPGSAEVNYRIEIKDSAGKTIGELRADNPSFTDRNGSSISASLIPGLRQLTISRNAAAQP